MGISRSWTEVAIDEQAVSAEESSLTTAEELRLTHNFSISGRFHRPEDNWFCGYNGLPVVGSRPLS